MKNLSFVLILGFTGLFAPHVSCAQYVPEKSFAEKPYAYPRPAAQLETCRHGYFWTILTLWCRVQSPDGTSGALTELRRLEHNLVNGKNASRNSFWRDNRTAMR